MTRTFLVFPKSAEQLLWEQLRHELSRQYVVPDNVSAESLMQFMIVLNTPKEDYNV